MTYESDRLTRRGFLAGTAAAALTGAPSVQAAPEKQDKAAIALTLDLEMSRHYPRRGLTEWDYQKGNLDKATKAYSLKAARVAHDRGAKIHFPVQITSFGIGQDNTLCCRHVEHSTL